MPIFHQGHVPVEEPTYLLSETPSSYQPLDKEEVCTIWREPHTGRRKGRTSIIKLPITFFASIVRLDLRVVSPSVPFLWTRIVLVYRQIAQ